jgi:transposase
MQHRDRICKLFRTVGCWQDVNGDIATRLAMGEFRCHDGAPCVKRGAQRRN